MQPKHQQELLKSKLSDSIIANNFISLNGNSWDYLLYSLGKEERRNDGRLRDVWIKKYSHLDYGGWWCNGGIDLTSLNSDALVNQQYGQQTEWGCFKPNVPRIIKGKPIKYEHPPHASVGIFALKIQENDWIKIGDKIDVREQVNEQLEEECLVNSHCPEIQFWQWVIDNPTIPVIITEGAKKGGSVLSAGYPCVALAGISTGWIGDTGELLPDLKALCTPGREFIIAFDQDSRFTTKISVYRAIKRLGGLLEDQDCQVSVLSWDSKLGKGIDDFIAKEGEEKLDKLFEQRTALADYLQDQGIHRLSPSSLLEFIQRQFGQRLEYNELTQRIELDGNPFDIGNEIRYWLIEEYQVDCHANAIIDAFLYVAKKKTYHPVERYLLRCHQQGKFINLDNLSQRFLGTTDPFYDVLVKKWLIGAVARALEPGCQMDQALILMGRTNTGKTNFFRILGGSFFDGSFGSNLESRQSLMVLHRSWIQEWGEFERIVTKREAGEIKDFVTRLSDCFVKPYGREALDYPRRFVFCGTCNEDDFLRDRTGSRRFLVVPIPQNWAIPLEVLESERDLIWASAVEEYKKAKAQGINAWVLSKEEYQELELSNQQFRDVDEWEFVINQWAEKQQKEEFTIIEILRDCFEIEDKDPNHKRQQMRVSTCLKLLGWTKIKPKADQDGNKKHYWIKPSFVQENKPKLIDDSIDTNDLSSFVEDLKEMEIQKQAQDIEGEWFKTEVRQLRYGQLIEIKDDLGSYWKVEKSWLTGAEITLKGNRREINFKTPFKLIESNKPVTN